MFNKTTLDFHSVDPNIENRYSTDALQEIEEIFFEPFTYNNANTWLPKIGLRKTAQITGYIVTIEDVNQIKIMLNDEEIYKINRIKRNIIQHKEEHVWEVYTSLSPATGNYKTFSDKDEACKYFKTLTSGLLNSGWKII